MANDRFEALKAMLANNPQHTFARYGLAMEYVNSGQYDDAVTEFRALLDADPDYSAGYFHLGRTYERLGRIDEAREIWERGIEVTTRKGDLHTRSELQAALDLLV